MRFVQYKSYLCPCPCQCLQLSRHTLYQITDCVHVTASHDFIAVSAIKYVNNELLRSKKCEKEDTGRSPAYLIWTQNNIKSFIIDLYTTIINNIVANEVKL